MGLLEFKLIEAQDVHITAHQSSLSTIARPLPFFNGDWMNNANAKEEAYGLYYFSYAKFSLAVRVVGGSRAANY
eukprot:scaffold9831_cov172-Skeletonema_dohrnii-CCMP3373.AAC.2